MARLTNTWNRPFTTPRQFQQFETRATLRRRQHQAMTRPVPCRTPLRSRILALVQAIPGIHVRRLSILTGSSWNACLHHLRVLESEGSVVHRKVGALVCWYDRSKGAVHNKDAAALLGDGRNVQVARLVANEPGQNQNALAERLGCAPSSVHRRVRRMEAAGLLRRDASFGAMRVYPSDGLGALADRAGMDLGGPAAW